MLKLLLLEDDPILSETLQLFLMQESYAVDVALSMEEAEDLTFNNRYDLYLFDINLPQGSGLELLKGLRHASDETPTIFITADTDLHSLSQSFELGALDYIRKPFDPQELLIRLQSKFKNDTLIYGNIEYQSSADILRQNGDIIDIGNVQFKIFTTLLKHLNCMVDKYTLLECLDHHSESALRVAITKIKQRLNIDIKNIRGKGYILEKL